MIRDIFLYMIIMFIIAITLLVAYIAFDEFNTMVQANDNFNNLSKQVMADQTTDFPRVWDYVFLMVFVGVVAGLLILSWNLDTNPAVFFIMLLVVVVAGGIAGYLSNAFYDLIQETLFQSSASHFPIMSFIINNYLVFIIVLVMLMTVVFYAKPSEGYV